jgi:hypothetical protein
VDFLRSHEAYKCFWGDQDQPSYRRLFFAARKTNLDAFRNAPRLC